MEDKSVFLYALSTCGHCRETKRFLSENNIAYDFIDVDLLEGKEKAEIIKDVRNLNPACTFPTVKIGERVVVGFKKNELEEALGLS